LDQDSDAGSTAHAVVGGHGKAGAGGEQVEEAGFQTKRGLNAYRLGVCFRGGIRTPCGKPAGHLLTGIGRLDIVGNYTKRGAVVL